MYVHPDQLTTRLRTSLRFTVMDMRDKQGFPANQEGIVFLHHEKREVPCKYTGEPIKRNVRYLVRTAAGEQGWRVDRLPVIGKITETVYGPNRETHWATNHEAAAALEAHLEHVRTHSSLGHSL